MTDKEILLQETRENITKTQEQIAKLITKINTQIGPSEGEISESEDIRMLDAAISDYYSRYLQQLHNLHPTPYFARLDLELEGEDRKVYVGKYGSEECNIISWTAPAAALRFQEMGSVTYSTPEEGELSGVLKRKDQYMIVNGVLTFFAHETKEQARQLIYQEYLSNQNRGFALPEIVAQMEKAQDDVIRAEAKGSFSITGPAGSGKTTLALHRVAFLTQSPDTARQYPGHKILVLVQDQSTRSYFGALLPQLGIHDVVITTFSDWALGILKLQEFSFTSYTNWGDKDQHVVEWEKIETLRSKASFPAYKLGSDPFVYLQKIYGSRHGLVVGYLDRYDLTILLSGYAVTNRGFCVDKVFSVRQKNGATIHKKKRTPLTYPLIVVDEFQNYLPEQLALFSGCVSPQTESILYVGDAAQQTHFGSTPKEPSKRKVHMAKVYRNTLQILEYISSRGFALEIPEGIKEGPEVREITPSQNALKAEIENYLEKNPGTKIGVISLHENNLSNLRNELLNDRVHFLTTRQAQGVEFDLVVYIQSSPSEVALENVQFQEESARIERDLLYVALTRAINELWVAI